MKKRTKKSIPQNPPEQGARTYWPGDALRRPTDSADADSLIRQEGDGRIEEKIIIPVVR